MMWAMKSVVAGILISTLGAAAAAAAEGSGALSSLQNRSIAYVITNDYWAIYTTPDKKECPQGLNEYGPREQFAVLYPKDGPARKVVETELDYEKNVWFPTLDPYPIEFNEGAGKTAPGLNLDGKDGSNDFVSPDGETGIDNQFHRFLACISDYRPEGTLHQLWDHFMHYHNYTRVLIELTDVDNLSNDDDVTVTMYRGMDDATTDATGTSFLPYGTQRIDTRWGKDFTKRMHGKIANGLLTTEPVDTYFPYNYAFEDFGRYMMRGARLKLNLTPESAHGLWAGYVDIWSWYRTLIGALGTHSMNQGRQAAPSMYRAMHKLADAYPDAKTGQNTALSAAREVTFRQVFIDHSEKKVAAIGADSQ